ncbi:Piso0_001989 [Millerozyma farinosa CBS 7064]|uniref:Piso0_001989 protein n=1 Tax=Pichia sorbitophila (strain ATCC MYA-4447 / BCRC 22081 / CBS 7064 / NBRC 10061 / NRRL Y-12695) TaxID=559304 RepID=G8YBE1_PICSO|nr:Piso0_001989 [Millerozyma farinosa CBS 7064]
MVALPSSCQSPHAGTPMVRLFHKGELKKTGAACSRGQAVIGGRYWWGKCVSRKFASQIAEECVNRDYMSEYDIIISSSSGHQRRVGG